MTWIRRQDLEDRELHQLSPWAAQSRRSGGRRLPEAEDPLRTAFQRDRDRIIHSSAFRRLQHKTQVFAAHEGDHYRSRMTHSLEVSQMARGGALALSLNPDLAEAVALAHDLGHPPFGHVGEDCLDQLMRGKGGFRHNAQGVRIVDVLEDRGGDGYGYGYGLNLTLLVRRSLLKGTIPAGFPVSEDLLPKEEPPLEAHLVDKCDKIAYLCHDLDDALRAGLVQEQEAAELRLWQVAAGRCGGGGRLRIVSEMVAALFQDLVSASHAELSGGRPQIRHGDEMQVLGDELLRFLRERFYHSERILAEMERGRERLTRLFQQFLETPDEIPAKVASRAKRDGLKRVVCDYMAGMTDRFLLRLEI